MKFKRTNAFPGISVDDIPAAQQYYGDTLGLDVTEKYDMLTPHIDGGNGVLVYPKGDDHTPATCMILNWAVFLEVL